MNVKQTKKKSNQTLPKKIFKIKTLKFVLKRNRESNEESIIDTRESKERELHFNQNKICNLGFTENKEKGRRTFETGFQVRIERKRYM